MSEFESGLSAEVFAFASTKAGKVMISHHGKQVTVLQGSAARKFISAIESMSVADAQRYMASATGQYKFGNERRGKLVEKNRTRS